MFIGEYSHNLDEKWRIALPKKFRDAFISGAIITRGFDNCLFVYTNTQWEVLAQKLATLPFSQAHVRAFTRLMLAGAMDVTLDKQGRIIIPEYLRTFADLKKQVVITGMYDRLEIWDQETWAAYKARTEKESTDIAEKMAELGI